MLHKQTFAVSTLGNRGRGIATEHKAGLDAIIAGGGDAAAAAMIAHLARHSDSNFETESFPAEGKSLATS